MAKKKLTPKHELFCQLYSKDRDCFGNGTQAYLKTTKTLNEKAPTYKTARTMAYNLLTNRDIMARVRELVDIYISNEVVDKELGSVILQSGDLGAKVQGIREYNKVKGRLAATKIKFVDDNEDLTDQQIEDALAERERQSKFGKKSGSEKKA